MHSSIVGLLVFCLGLCKGEDELLAVSLLYRHGDRTPLSFAPNDPYQDPSVWSTAPGELTNEGKQQLYQLGEWLRLRYDGFISSIYDKNEIYVHSSDHDRCLMSAAAKLAGLYKPKGKDVWNKNLPWQPIPVHTQPARIDDIAEMEKSCPIFLKLLRENGKTPRLDAMWKKYEKLFEFLTKKTGARFSSTYDVWLYHDTIKIEHLYNLTLPDWTLDALPKLQEFCEAATKIYTETPQTTRLSTGRFYNELLKQFQNILSDDLNTHKLKAYALHDTQIFSVLDALKVPNIGLPPYAALVIFELRSSSGEDPYVQIFYKTGDSPNVVLVPECGPKCAFDFFKKKLQNISITSEEFNEECKL